MLLVNIEQEYLYQHVRGFNWNIFLILLQTRHFLTPTVFSHQFFPLVVLFWLQFSGETAVELQPTSGHFAIAFLFNISNVMCYVWTSEAAVISPPLSFQDSKISGVCKALEGPLTTMVLNVENLVAREDCVMMITCVQGVFSFLLLSWPWQKATSEQGLCQPSRCNRWCWKT